MRQRVIPRAAAQLSVHTLDMNLVAHGPEHFCPVFGIFLGCMPRACFKNPVAAMVASICYYPVHD